MAQLAEKVVRFLRRGARPALIKADDKTIEIAPNGRVRWKDVDQTIAAIGPKKLECLDGRGNVLRAMEIEGDVTDDESEKPSPEMSDVQLFARLISESFDKGGSNAIKMLAEAMKFIEHMGVRLNSSDREVDRLRMENTKLRREIAQMAALPADETGDGGIVQELISGFLAAKQAASVAEQGAVPISAAKGKRS